MADDESDTASDSDSNETDGTPGVQLGFVEAAPDDAPVLFEAANWRDWDGGVAGGDPVWLDASPPPEELKCPACDARLSFVAAIYAPLDAPRSAFHRGLYVFCCAKGCRGSARAVRSQLPRANAIYEYDPQEDDGSPRRRARHIAYPMGPRICERRFEIVVEPEPALTKKPRGEEEEAPVVSQTDPSSATLTLDDDDADSALTQRELNAATGAASVEDAATLRFLSRVAREPAQVLRYQRRGRPLWISTKFCRRRRRRPNDDDVETSKPKPPDCEHCGAPRSFEFMLLPQLLHYLKPDRLNFGAILVFTCDESCGDMTTDNVPDNRSSSSSLRYRNEFVCVQPPLDDHPRLS